MIESIFEDIGLSKNETKIYLALLESGPSLVGEISSKTKIHRRNVYDSIDMLKGKGFVSSTIINNKNVIEAVDPKRILDILEERKTSLEKVIPKILNNVNGRKEIPVNIYTGSNGRKIVFEDKLKFSGEQIVLGAHAPNERREIYLDNYHNRRIKNNITLKILFADDDDGFTQKLLEYGKVKIRKLPDRLSSPIAINVYGNKTALLLGSEMIEPITILIEDKDLADDFRAYFNMLWKLSSEI